ncbi:hypothetical protein BCR37DRAFT_108220 [Protomyces lactucae-debilis]|uniref:HotDog domain-containing protein n=1 Tax=Protomyces lactucae-debilis TaxID=2754530 RepID=A0A1Y2F3V6_PROLT|nr:uncharacterized protein BCR37DRAFT_108220 [Protomyces lactucae-debilis]ORY78552.1 hypothetical protein BCR37DRAFT_108220 [Protomyces lactucae-debilis]
MVFLHRTASYSTRSNSFKHFTSPNDATRAFFKQRGYYPDGDSCLLHRIPWGHLDSLGHLNNAQYLSVIESSRIHYFDVLAQRHPGFPPFFLAPKGICPVFRQANVQWRRQLVRNDIVGQVFGYPADDRLRYSTNSPKLVLHRYRWKQSWCWSKALEMHLARNYLSRRS